MDKQAKKYTIGSLFDGSGGFPLAGSLCGIEPMWAAEVEPYPIAVTRSRFPNMKHLGDISKVNGAVIEPVDIITFGSPCQDLSVAGKRAGLKHEANGDDETTRSGLFMEAVRIIKEMREETNGVYPTFAVWENVPGAFSSNEGEDFRVVLEELIKIVEPTASLPPVPKGGWAYADSFVGDGWSLAYRVFDAQYWGVPQRRRRIYLVADFRGERAREILFEREGLRGYFETGRTPWKTAPAYAQGSTPADDRAGEGFDGYNGDLTGEVSSTLGVNCVISTGRNGVVVKAARCKADNEHLPVVAYTMKERAGCAGGGKGPLVQADKSATLATNNDQYLFQPIGCIASSAANAELTDGNISPCLMARAGTGGNQLPLVACSYDARWNGNGTTSSTITGDHENRITDYTSVVVETIALEGNGQRPSHKGDGYAVSDKSYTLNTTEVHGVCYEEPVPIHDQATRFSGKRGEKMDGKGNGLGVGEPGDPMNTLTQGDRHAVAYGFDPQADRDVGRYFHKNIANTLVNGTCPGHKNGVVYCLDRASFNQGKNAQFDFSILEEQQPTITARGPGAVCHDNPPHYIVRRLTPTECARLQGFADWWSYLEAVDHMSQKDYQFWLNVRNTHAAINGREVKDYNVKQMLTWYNKLWTDSAEYKMWGNGIALPCALYVMQGIADALSNREI